MAEDGMVLMSTTRVALEGCGRLPLINTRLRLLPRPRRFRGEAPGVLEAELWMSAAPPRNCVSPGVNWGNLFMTDSILTVAEFSNASAPTVKTGLGADRSLLVIREPVTVISSRPA